MVCLPSKHLFINDIFFLYRSDAARRRQLNLVKKTFQKEMDTLSTRKPTATSQPDKRLKNYRAASESKMDDTMNNFSLNDGIGQTPASSAKNKRSISTTGVKVENVARPSKEENRSLKSRESQQHVDPNTPSVEKRLRPQYSAVTISRVKPSLNTSETSNDNDLNKSMPLHHEPNEFASASMSKLHMIKLPQNKVSASAKTVRNMNSEPSLVQTNLSDTNNTTSDFKSSSAHFQGIPYPGSPRPKHIRSPGQQRAKVFSHVSVSKIKPINN
jgi:hypothetical protein